MSGVNSEVHGYDFESHENLKKAGFFADATAAFEALDKEKYSKGLSAFENMDKTLIGKGEKV